MRNNSYYTIWTSPDKTKSVCSAHEDNIPECYSEYTILNTVDFYTLITNYIGNYNVFNRIYYYTHFYIFE